MQSREILQERRALLAVLIVLAVGFAYLMAPFWMPVILAAITSLILFPIYDKLRVAFGDRPRLASLTTTILIFFGLILPSVWVGTILIDEVVTVAGQVDLKHTFSKWFTTDLYKTSIEPFITDIETKLNTKIDVFGLLTQAGQSVATQITSYSPRVAFGTAAFVFEFFVMLVTIYFLFVEGPNLLEWLYDLSPLRDHHRRRLIFRLKQTIDASVYGYLVTGLVQGILAAVLFAFVGLKTFVILGTLTFIFSLVPIVGASGIWIPVCIWLFLQGHTTDGFIVFVGGVAGISLVDNFLKPILIEGKTKIHPLLIFFSIFGGIQFFGPVGLIFGPVITSLLIGALIIYRQEIS